MYYFMSIAPTIENKVPKDGTKFFVRLLVFCYEIILILIFFGHLRLYFIQAKFLYNCSCFAKH